MIKILNLYAGIGGNRSLWTDCKVTAIECDGAVAAVYQKLYPNDRIICGDAHRYLEEHFDEYDFIWSSPPCPSHGQYRHNVGVLGKGFRPLMPDMKLYAEIVFLSTYFKGRFCVENVKPYYEPLIKPTTELQRHLFWTNFPVEHRDFASAKIRSSNKLSDFEGYEIVQESSISNKRQVLRNRVDPMLGYHIFMEATK